MTLKMRQFPSFLMAEHSIVSVCARYIFAIHSSLDGHLGCFCVSPIVHTVAVNMEVQMLLLRH